MHHFTVTALTECCICFIRTDTLRELLHTNPLFTDAYLKHISQVTLAAYNRLINLTQKHMTARLAESLIYLSNEVFDRKNFEVPFSSQELAELSGMSRDNVVRNMKKFENDGIVQKKDGLISIIDYETLVAISQED